MSPSEHWDVVIVGSGPAGVRGAVEAAAAGRRVLVVEQQAMTGGACVEFGTIPSKTLRETAVCLTSFRRRTGDCFDVEAREDLKLRSLMRRLSRVVSGYQLSIADELDRSGVSILQGRARFVDARRLEVTIAGGGSREITGDVILLAIGSRPRVPPNVPVDHEWILDSDSILSLNYLPASLIVLGSGVIACEYASIFAALGVRVTVVDCLPRPMAFLDPELSAGFLHAFEATGAEFIGGVQIRSVETDGFSSTAVILDNGKRLEAEKTFVGLGRAAAISGLGIEAAGLATTSRGHLVVDDCLCTNQPHIFAAGDVIGPPALATSSMEQGRRAIRHALGLPPGSPPEQIPTGIYTIPEISCVGLNEEDARKRHGAVTIGRASFAELARGEIAALDGGFLKLVVATGDGRLLGVQILGEGASELIHLGQMALVAGLGSSCFIENLFNFPTLAEAYRVAALDVERLRSRVSQAAEPVSV